MTFGTRVRRGWWTDSCFNNCQSWVTFGSLLFPHSKQQLKSKRNTHKSEWSSLSYDLKVEGHDHCSLKAVFIMLTFKSFLLLLFFCHVMSATWLASHHHYFLSSSIIQVSLCLTEQRRYTLSFLTMGNTCSNHLGIPPAKGPNAVGCTDFMMDHTVKVRKERKQHLSPYRMCCLFV